MPARPVPPSARRQLLRWLAALPLLGTLAAPRPAQPQDQPLRPTPPDGRGPFYPVAWEGEVDADLTRVGNLGAQAEGQPLTVSGVLRDTAGRPLPGALVEIWQADARGHYRHPGDDAAARDPRFQGFGRTRSGADGSYRFRTIRPPGYGSRPPHIHFRVVAPDGRELVTQMYFAGDNANAGARRGFSRSDREALSVTPTAGTDGMLSVRFDLVLPS